MRPARVLALLLAGSLLASTGPAWGFHTVFHFHVDRFEADGNVFGPADGMADFVDNFDGTSLTNWIKLYGTVSVSEGMLHVESPGDHFAVGFPVDVSEVWSATQLTVDGGVTVLTSYWLPPVLTPGSSLHMTLALAQADDYTQFIGLHVQHTGSDGPAIGFHILRRVGETWLPLQIQAVPYDADAVVDRVVLRLALDAGEITASFSLDGGTTFQSPFTPGVVLPNLTTGRLMLGADPIATVDGPGCGNAVVDPGETCDLGMVQNGYDCCTHECTLVDADGDGVCDPKDICPAAPDPAQLDGDGDGLGDACDPCTPKIEGQRRWGRPLVALGHLNDYRPGNESLRVAGSFSLPPEAPALDPVATGARLVLRSERDGSTVAIALPGGAYVDPGPGWETDAAGTRFAFRDRRRGGTHGVRKMVVRRTADGRVRLALAAPRGSFDLGAWSFPPIRASVAFGDAPDACAEIRFAARACAYPASRRIVCR